MKRIIGLLKRNKLYRYLVIVAISYVMAGVVHATEDQPVPNSFSSGDVASSSEVNENFDWLVERSWDLDDTSGTDIYYNVTDGNVGIGTDQPDFKLDVDGGSGTAINAQSIGGNTINATSSAGGGYAAIRASATGSGTYGIWSSSTEYVGGRFESTSGNALEAITDSGNAGIFMGGNVGIGTTTPAGITEGRTTLHVAGSSTPSVVWEQTGSTAGKWIAFLSVADGGFILSDYTGSSGLHRLAIDPNGNVGVGLTGPTLRLQVNGTAGGTYAWTTVSDVSYKKNVTTITDALDMITQLRGVYFEWEQDESDEMNFSEGRQVGFIAQEVNEVLPEAVHEDASGIQSISYSLLVPVLVEAIKEQQASIDMLRQEIDLLKSRR